MKMRELEDTVMNIRELLEMKVAADGDVMSRQIDSEIYRSHLLRKFDIHPVGEPVKKVVDYTENPFILNNRQLTILDGIDGSIFDEFAVINVSIGGYVSDRIYVERGEFMLVRVVNIYDPRQTFYIVLDKEKGQL